MLVSGNTNGKVNEINGLPFAPRARALRGVAPRDRASPRTGAGATGKPKGIEVKI